MDSLPELIFAQQNNFGNTRSGSLIGPLGGFVVAALIIATLVLIRSMNARLRRLPERFPQASTGDKPAPQPSEQAKSPADQSDSA